MTNLSNDLIPLDNTPMHVNKLNCQYQPSKSSIYCFSREDCNMERESKDLENHRILNSEEALSADNSTEKLFYNLFNSHILCQTAMYQLRSLKTFISVHMRPYFMDMGFYICNLLCLKK